MIFAALLGCLAGLSGVYIRLRGEFPRGITYLTLAVLAGATALTWYTLFEPSPTDTIAFGVVAWLGVLAAASSVPAAHRWRRVVAWIGLFVVPLAAVWLTARPASLAFGSSHWSAVLFSSWHGFLSWTPAVYVAALGTIAYVRRDRVWALGALVVLFVTAWTLGATTNWATEPAFAGRSMVSVLALLAPGLAYALDAARRRPVVGLAALVAVSLVWNYLLMVQYTVGLLPKDEPVSFARLVRQQADVLARTSRLYPFAFPANVLFAWREGVPPDRYDVLALEPRRSSLDLVMDRNVDRFLLTGWDAPGAPGDAPSWWIGGRQASLAVPLTLPHDRGVEIMVRARSRFEEPVVEADLAVQVNGRELGQFSPSAHAPTEWRTTIRSATAAEIFRDGFNHITFVSRGMHRVDASDTRPPGPLAKRAGHPAWPVAIYRIVIAPR